MNPKVAGYVTYSQDPAIDFIESIHVIPLCYACLAGRSSFHGLPTKINAHTAKHFSAGEGDRKRGRLDRVGDFFPTELHLLKPSVTKGVKNDRTTARM
jgi:hypothetical protein